jgi:hypothetical protein
MNINITYNLINTDRSYTVWKELTFLFQLLQDSSIPVLIASISRKVKLKCLCLLIYFVMVYAVRIVYELTLLSMKILAQCSVLCRDDIFGPVREIVADYSGVI